MRNVQTAVLLAMLLSVAQGSALAADPQVREETPEPDATAEVAQAPQDLSATGDAWVDAQLDDINRYAARHRAAFIDELARYREAPRGLVEALLDERGWEPGDVYFACALATVTGRSCRFVVDRRGHPPDKGWHALAEELGAGAGSEAFTRLRQGIAASYRRWARPPAPDVEPAGAPAEAAGTPAEE